MICASTTTFGFNSPAIVDTLVVRCQSRIAESQDDILAEIRGLTAAKETAPVKTVPAAGSPRDKAAAKKPPQRKTAVEWS